jgi:hypothetical protein
MKYGLLICPRCGMAKGVEASRKTTTCQCGREIDLRRVKLRYTTDSPLELADSVAKANAALRGGQQLPPEKRPRRKDPFFVIAERAKLVKDPVERMKVIAKGLTDLKSSFGVEDVRRVVVLLGKGSAEDVIKVLQEHNLVYETADGRFKAV